MLRGASWDRTTQTNLVTATGSSPEHPETRTEASETFNGLIDAIVMTPDERELRIELKGIWRRCSAPPKCEEVARVRPLAPSGGGCGGGSSFSSGGPPPAVTL